MFGLLDLLICTNSYHNANILKMIKTLHHFQINLVVPYLHTHKVAIKLSSNIMSDSPILSIANGKLRGKVEQTRNGYTFNSFLGVPFAKPPLGDLRFQAPQPVEPWQDIRNATKEGDSCYSYDAVMNKTGDSEDCLYLNVFTPVLPTPNSKPKAVMVWIHGGAYHCGSGKREFYDPDYLIERDIVLVVINYRLGILGFLALEDQSLAPANVGLRDQVAALNWIQTNIHNFGGDSSNVTIFGNSAGAGSVHLLMLSPLTKGLFHKAIMQSGSSMCPWSIGQINGMTMCKLLKKEVSNEKEALKILRNVSVKELIAAQNSVPDSVYPSFVRAVAPLVEGNNENAFLPEHPEKLLTCGAFHKIPVLIGHTSGEGYLVQIVENLRNINLCPPNLEVFIPITYGIAMGTPKSIEIAKMIKDFYFGDEEPSKANKQIFYKIFSHTLFINAIYRTIEETLKHSREKLYFYRMSLLSELNNFAKLGKVVGDGVTHGEDIFYIFKNNVFPYQIKPGSIEDMTVQRMTKWWSNFAKHGDPNGVQDDVLLQPKWPNANADKLQCLDIDTNISIQNYPEKKYIDFWKSLENFARAN